MNNTINNNFSQQITPAILAEIAHKYGHGKETKTRGGWSTLCPCHDDHNNSLSIKIGDKVPLVVKCHTGCDGVTVLQKIESEFPEFFPKKKKNTTVKRKKIPLPEHIYRKSKPITDRYLSYFTETRGINFAEPALKLLRGIYRVNTYNDTLSLIAPMTKQPGGAIEAVHLTVIEVKGKSAPVKTGQKYLGPKTGRGGWIGDIKDKLAIGEGAETSLSFFAATGVPIAIAGDAGNLRNIAVPDTVKSLYILVDQDWEDNKWIGQYSALEAVRAYQAQGKDVSLVTPTADTFNKSAAKEKKDFNDLAPKEIRARFETAIMPGDVPAGEWQDGDQGERRGLYAVEIKDFVAMDLPPRKNLMSPWLPEQGLCMIHAPRGIGKTWVALNIAYAIAAGTKFLRWTVHKPCGAIYLDGEMPVTTIQDRILHIADAVAKPTRAPFKIITPDLQPDKKPMPNIAIEDGQAEINQLIDEKTKLIIVDNISCLCSDGEENSAESWNTIQTWALYWRARGKSILFIHHSGKSGKQRGTSRREDVLDTVINLKAPAAGQDSKQGACFQVVYEKSRGFYGDDAAPFEAELIDNQWVMRTLEDSTYAQVIKLAREGLTQAEIARELELNRSTVSRHFKKAKEFGELVSR